jgi:hypothetical protein
LPPPAGNRPKKGERLINFRVKPAAIRPIVKHYICGKSAWAGRLSHSELAEANLSRNETSDCVAFRTERIMATLKSVLLLDEAELIH